MGGPGPWPPGLPKSGPVEVLEHHSYANVNMSIASLAGWKPITRVTREPIEIKRLKVKVNRPINAAQTRDRREFP